MARYSECTVFEAPRGVVYEVFADRERYGTFLPLAAELIRPGDTERQGVGAVHRVGVGPIGPKEQIIDLVPGERIQYRVVGGLPVRLHIGTIELADRDQGTEVRYTMESVPRVPVPAALMRALLRQSVGTFIKGARKESIRRAGALG